VKPREFEKPKHRKFTWIEALAAVAILMILASLSMPVLSSAKRKRRLPSSSAEYEYSASTESLGMPRGGSPRKVVPSVPGGLTLSSRRSGWLFPGTLQSPAEPILQQRSENTLAQLSRHNPSIPAAARTKIALPQSVW